eukprot:g8551.t1
MPLTRGGERSRRAPAPQNTFRARGGRRPRRPACAGQDGRRCRGADQAPAEASAPVLAAQDQGGADVALAPPSSPAPPAGPTSPGEAAEAPTRVQDLEEQSARCTTAVASSVVWDQVRQEVISEAEARLEAFLRRDGPIEGLDWTVLQQEVLAALRGPAGGQRGLSRGGDESGEPPAKRRKTEVANAGGAEPAAASLGVPSQPPGGQAGSAA